MAEHGQAGVVAVPGDGVHAWDAFILLTDIVGFSEHPQWRQVEMVRHLFEGMLGHRILKERAPGSYLLSSTGDGFLLALPTDGPLELPLTFCDAARELVRHAGTYPDAPLRIRVGIHRGDVVTGLRVDPIDFAVGVGLNWCARVASAAGPSQVLVSERFFTHVVDRVGPRGMGDRFFPPAADPPLQMVVKHGRSATVRVLRDRTGDAPVLDAEVPDQLTIDLQITRHIDQALRIVALSVESALASLDATLDRDAMRLRLSLWVRRDDHLERLPIEISLAGAGVVPGQGQRVTRYCLHRGAELPPEGPVARCFLSSRCQSVVGIPSEREAPEAYLATLAAEGIPEARARAFSRPARSLLCVPLPLLQGEPAGVLCIDCLAPLSDWKEAVDALLEEIQAGSGYFLAALLQLRVR